MSILFFSFLATCLLFAVAGAVAQMLGLCDDQE